MEIRIDLLDTDKTSQFVIDMMLDMLQFEPSLRPTPEHLETQLRIYIKSNGG